MISKQYNIIQLRVNLWNHLKEQSNKISAQSKSESSHQGVSIILEILENLLCIEQYFAFPGATITKEIIATVKNGEQNAISHRVSEIVSLLVSDDYRNHPELRPVHFETAESLRDRKISNAKKNSFEVLYVEDLSEKEEILLKKKFNSLMDDTDTLTYNLVVQRSFQDALIGLFFNYNIQAAVIRYAPLSLSNNITKLIKPFIQNVLKIDLEGVSDIELGPLLGHYIHQFRPELDLYYITDTSLTHLKDTTLHAFRRIFYRMEDMQELHLTILSGINERYETPFFTALTEYSKLPISIFHALPISRGNSVFKSRWISDFGDFYGRNVFLAETSATNGGLDSLLQPKGPIKQAQKKAAKAYGAQHTFFVTNGTSTANKIVQQALIKPGDIVLVDRDCHKSHHYGLVLAGAFPAYLDSYPIEKYSMYGAVPLRIIREKLIELSKAGRLNKLKMLLLTNCTFDGLVYNVEKIMEAVLSIKPDMVFLWDEAWFAFASFTYTYKQRTGMYVAQKLFHKYKTPAYRTAYNEHLKNLLPGEFPSMPDPDKVKIRVYATQSTHKTLSSFRQGSMIHIWDEEFSRKVTDAFHEAYMTHTTTSPNYQILASLDAGRRQIELEGYELVEQSIEMAMIVRSKIKDHPQLSKYFHLLSVSDLIPLEFRECGENDYYTAEKGWNRMEESWEKDEFVLDPTKLTLSIGKTGITGDVFKNVYLMDRFNIQINKTSRNTILLMTNIGTTRGSVTFLINALLQIADELDKSMYSLNKREAEISKKEIHSLIYDVPPLPDFSSFHHSFLAAPGVPGGNIREAFFLGYEEDLCEYVLLSDCLLQLENNKVFVSTSFVIPYPPGFPILVPGQVVSAEIIKFMLALDVTEVHGYRAALGLKVFTQMALNRKNTISAMGAMHAMNAIHTGTEK
ncbi:ornithine decarboxylase [Polaribacter litorisediminis]|uniref:aminotransferase class I/II-fold pyridoxal phosphate-dependent enzyme n=1 Tax=Polaribacter litorisediminis TaxID=1908341 RepID=UPI001CC0B745|nr:ornithine decarboxylase [Polaribacter litorisediminis]UAM98810.1 ornithine decarboxylase [Polaribacter litorisediminis]